MKATNLSAEIEQWGSVETGVQRLFGNLKTATTETAAAQMDADGSLGTAEEGVTLEISDEAKQKYIEKMTLQMQMEQMRKQSEEAEEHADDLGKIMTIFRRIANGDIVPMQDERKLMEYNKEMYMAAKNIASMKENEDPKKYKSVDEEEENRNTLLKELESFEGAKSEGIADSGAVAEALPGVDGGIS